MASTKQRQAEAKLRKQLAKIGERKATAILKHYTKPHWVEKIKQDGYIDVEGCNITPEHPNYAMLEYQYKLLGRFVWFTETTANSVVSMTPSFANQLKCFEFAAKDLEVEHWPQVRERLTGNALKFAKALDEMARLNGDDPNKWWVSAGPVSLALAQKVC